MQSRLQWPSHLRLLIYDLRVASEFSGTQSSFVNRNSQRSQGVMSSARRSAEAEVRGANPRESANLFSICDFGLAIGLRAVADRFLDRNS